VAGIEVDTANLRAAAEATRAYLDELTANSPEHQALVQQLEAQVDAEDADGPAEAAPDWPGPMPTGDDLVAEVERFLRDQGE